VTILHVAVPPRILQLALACGVMVPVLYFGVQAVAAPWYPGFDVLRVAASDLGSPQSQCPQLFNTGALLCGACGVFAGPGLFTALRARGIGAWLAGLFGLAAAWAGFGALWAGWFAMPHPRHAEPWPSLGLFLIPLLTALLAWRGLWRNQPALRLYAWANFGAFLIFIPLLSPLGDGVLDGARGLLQRLAAATAFGPIGVVAWSLLRRWAIREGAGGIDR
jgi:Protein of unknown function (DUF998)